MESVFNINKYLGARFYTYLDNDTLEVIRVTGIQSSDRVRVRYERGPEAGKIAKLPMSYFKDNDYRLLLADGMMVFSYVLVKANQEGTKKIGDVIVAMYRQEDAEKNINVPYAACRQNISDIYQNYFKTGDAIRDRDYVGMSCNKANLPKGFDFNIMLCCEEVKEVQTVNFYMDDTLDTIMKMVKTRTFDNVLKSLFDDAINAAIKKYELPTDFKKHNKMTEYNGYCQTVKSLLELNNFMYDVGYGFGITTVDFELKDWDGLGNLGAMQEAILTNLFKKNITNAAMMIYDKDIDLDRIQQQYLLIRDKTQALYIVTYVEDGVYNEADLEVESARKTLLDIAINKAKYQTAENF